MFDQFPQTLNELGGLLVFMFLRLGLPLIILMFVGWMAWHFFAPQPVPHAASARAVRRQEAFGAFVMRVRELPSMQLPELSARQIMVIFVTLMLWIGAAGFLIARFFYGLNTATALSDYMPWGLWIAFKLSFVACAAGGFTFAAIVYVFRLDKYRPLARTAILTGLIGYTTFIISLVFDLGRWYNIWHVIIMWNLHSVMFEIAWCVMLYTAVLYAEFSPAFFERLGWHRAEALMHKITLPLVIAGVVLSTLHQSSLGSLYLIQNIRLSPLWWSPLIPVFFFTSAICAGLGIMMVVPRINVRAFHWEVKDELLASLARPAAIAIGIYLVLKVGDLLLRGQLPHLLVPSTTTGLWWLEVLFGLVLPMALLLTPQVAQNPTLRSRSALLVIGGIALNRFNIALFGFTDYLGTINVSYVPSFGEWVITLALFTAAIAFYIAAVKFLPILPRPKVEPQPVIAG